MTKVACIGECMIELKQAQGGLYSRGYGGDTLNTANYLARLGADVDYITALGDDPVSEEMLAGWAAEVLEPVRCYGCPASCRVSRRVKKLKLRKGGSFPTFLVLDGCCTTSLPWTLE